jgi:ABC-type multidrug transport system ATPase subunit
MTRSFQISLGNLGKRFNQEWIFRKLDYSFESGNAYAILGSNGSGKSTLLQIISGRMLPSEGKLDYSSNGNVISDEVIFRDVSISGPYLELIEEYTIPELLMLHTSLKPLLPGITTGKFLEILGFEKQTHKMIRYFSSGMKQRLKLGLAVLSDVGIVLLDEPCSNLDAQAMQWYKQLVEDYLGDRLVIVCSNHQEEEIGFCRHKLVVNDYK